MKPAREFDELGGGAFRWETYDPASKVDLSASALVMAPGLLFVDPIPLSEDALADLLDAADAAPAGIFLTNANHERASAVFSRRLSVPVYTLAAPPGGVAIIALPGAAPGEAALLHGDVLVIGDALINLSSHPFSILPDKYCEDPAELRRSLRKLAERDFDRVLFAHGEPVMTGARARLLALLGLATPSDRPIGSA